MKWKVEERRDGCLTVQRERLKNSHGVRCDPLEGPWPALLQTQAKQVFSFFFPPPRLLSLYFCLFFFLLFFSMPAWKTHNVWSLVSLSVLWLCSFFFLSFWFKVQKKLGKQLKCTKANKNTTTSTVENMVTFGFWYTHPHRPTINKAQDVDYFFSKVRWIYQGQRLSLDLFTPCLDSLITLRMDWLTVSHPAMFALVTCS